MNEKCLVYGCRNHNNEGEFKGELCEPCYTMLVHGVPGGYTREDFVSKLDRQRRRLRDIVGEIYIKAASVVQP